MVGRWCRFEMGLAVSGRAWFTRPVEMGEILASEFHTVDAAE